MANDIISDSERAEIHEEIERLLGENERIVEERAGLVRALVTNFADALTRTMRTIQ